MELLSTSSVVSSGTEVGGLLGTWRTEWLEREVAELRDFIVGRAIFERLWDEGDGLTAKVVLDLSVGLDTGDSTKWYRPVSGSASGADWMRV